MQKGLDPTKTTTCMKCRKVPSRYYGTWGEEGLCRTCILAMEGSVRRRVLRELHPAERKRWQLDELAERAREKAHAPKDDPPAPEPTPTPGGVARRYTEPYRHRDSPAPGGPGGEDRHDRRRHTRQFAELPVRFSVVADKGPAVSQFRGRTFRSVSKDVSIGGIRILIRDQLAFEIPAGCGLRLEISVPSGNSLVRCPGVVRNVVRTSRGRDAGYLCVQFDRPPGRAAEVLQQFLSRGRPRSTR